MENVKLIDICNPKQYKTISKNNFENSGFPIYGANGKIGFFNDYTHEFSTLLIGCRGSCGKINISDPKSYINGNAMALDNLNKNYSLKFLYYILMARGLDDVISGAVQPQITREGLSKVFIPNPPLETQKHIAQILDDAAALRDKTKELLKEYDALAQSVFLDMFGDPVRNEKGWKKHKLGKLGTFKNGLNYSKSENGNKLKVIGVGDFKNFSEIKNLDHISFIEMTELPKDDFLLKDKDLLFVRSNGNKELVGRCLMVFVGDEKVSYSGFCIRFRKNSSLLNTVYLVQLFQRKEFKKHIFKNGRGANIQNINQELLSNVDFQLPPIELQNQFAEKIALIEQQKELAKQELKESEDLFNCLLQKAFKGEIT